MSFSAKITHLSIKITITQEYEGEKKTQNLKQVILSGAA